MHSSGLSQHGVIVKWTLFSPGSVHTSFRSTSGLKGMLSLSVKGTPCMSKQVHPREGHNWLAPWNGPSRMCS